MSLVDKEEKESRKESNYETIHRLPPAAENINSSRQEGDSGLLPWEAKKQYEDIAKLLLATDGINVNARDNNSQTPLLWAAKKGYDTLVDLLLKSDGIDINAKDDWNKSSLLWATAKGHIAVVKLLLNEAKLDIN
ncbi:hypothetical protein M441DRAFT_153889, partial [Trichoderma asperellum CBS 433.97]